MKYLRLVLCLALLAIKSKSAQAVCGYEVRWHRALGHFMIYSHNGTEVTE